jgi:hypothetical protein
MSGFDSLAYAQNLRAVGVPTEQAETEAALVRDEVLSLTATKGDLLSVEQRLDTKIDRVEERLRAEIHRLGQQMTVKLGSLTIGGVAIILTAMTLLFQLSA